MGDPWRETLYTAALALIFYLGTYTARFPLFLLKWEGRTSGLDNKVWLSIAQVLGYASMKIPAIKYVSELPRAKRFRWVLCLYLGYCLLSTITLPFLSAPAASVFVFLGACCGSTIWGLVLQYLEGRESTDVLFAALNAVVVFGASLVRSVGEAMRRALPDGQERWMPFIVTIIFMPIAVTALILLDRVKEPTMQDKMLRSDRRPMSGTERYVFFCRFAVVLLPLLIAYISITAYRSYRDFFAPEIYGDILGRTPNPGDYLLADWPGGFVACFGLGVLVIVKSNRKAILLMNSGIVAGATFLALVTFWYEQGGLHPLAWASLATTGLMVSYTPTGSLFFERLLGATKTPGTSSFLVFLFDGFAYFGVIGILLVKNFSELDVDYGKSFIALTYILSFVVILLVVPVILWLKHFLVRDSPSYAALDSEDGGGVANSRSAELEMSILSQADRDGSSEEEVVVG